MLRKFSVLFVLVGLGLCFAACGDDDGASKSAEEYCNDFCNKMYDDCGDDYIDYMDELGVEVTEDDLEDMLNDCEDSCGGESIVDCYNEAYEDADLEDCIMSTELNTACADCQLEIDCGDYLEGDISDCEDECETDYDPDDCADAMADLDADELQDLNDALTECAE